MGAEVRIKSANGATPRAGAFETRRRVPWRRQKGLAAVLAGWERDGLTRSVVLDETLPARPAVDGPIPEALAPPVQEALAKRGITRLYAHQVEAVRRGLAGEDFVVATPTASGKSLCYNLPVLQRLATEPEARALYLFPTKALSRDQEEGLRGLLRDAGLPHGAITFDGDTPGDARRVAKERSGVILTNPDMLHASVLPHHTSWARLFANLRYVVVDELHSYRGVFGSHLANVVRRLRRIAAFHGASPSFILASATIGNPGEHASRIVGREVPVLGESGAPQGPRRVMVYNPPVVNPELGLRASYLKSAVRLATDLVRAGVPTLVFGQSRNGVEVMLKYLRDRLTKHECPAEAIHAYRGGYLPKQRRAIEQGLRGGSIRCVVATNALELGIDIGALDAVVCAGYPGTLAGTLQRFGRAGRREGEALGVLVTSSAPLDQYVAQDPRQILDAPVEHARIDPDNVEILVQHLKCAAFELPFEEGDRFGDLPAEGLADALGFLADHGVLHPAPNAQGTLVHHWATEGYPANHVSLRSVSWDNFVVVDLDTDKTIAEMDWRSTHVMLHVQAIYQHAGAQYQVERLDFENHKAFVRKVKPDYYTTAITHTKVTVTEEEDGAALSSGTAPGLPSGMTSGLPSDRRSDAGAPAPVPRLGAGLGEVSVVQKVVGYKKIKFHTHENVGYGDVRLPEMQMHTSAFWLTWPEELVLRCAAMRDVPRATIIDGLRGLLATLRVVAATGLMVDPRDLGTSVGDQSAEGAPPSSGGGGFDPTLFLYDAVPGGIGLAPRLFDERDGLLRRARSLIERCACARGCPACIGPDAGLPMDIPGLQRTPRKALVLGLLDDAGWTTAH